MGKIVAIDRRRFLWTLGGLAGVASCARLAPLTNAHPSASVLATAILAALVDLDRELLEALALSEHEFRDHVWPDLPASRPERNLPFSYVWGDLHQKSGLGLSTVINEHGGNRYELRGVTFSGTTDYSGCRVHRSTTLRVARADGAETDLHVCGSMLERGSMWKVFSYVVD